MASGDKLLEMIECNVESDYGEEIAYMAERIADVATNGAPAPAEVLVDALKGLDRALVELHCETMAILAGIEKNGLDAETLEEIHRVTICAAFLGADEVFPGNEGGLVGEVIEAMRDFKDAKGAEEPEEAPWAPHPLPTIKHLYLPSGIEFRTGVAEAL